MNIRELHKNISKIPQLIQGDVRIIVTKRDTQLFQIQKLEKEDQKTSSFPIEALLKLCGSGKGGVTDGSMTVDSIYL